MYVLLSNFSFTYTNLWYLIISFFASPTFACNGDFNQRTVPGLKSGPYSLHRTSPCRLPDNLFRYFAPPDVPFVISLPAHPHTDLLLLFPSFSVVPKLCL